MRPPPPPTSGVVFAQKVITRLSRLVSQNQQIFRRLITLHRFFLCGSTYIRQVNWKYFTNHLA